MNITVCDYIAAAGVTPATARRRLANVSHFRVSKTYRYSLPEALVTLKEKEINRGALQAMTAAADEREDRLYVGDHLQTALLLRDKLPPNERARFAVVRNFFFSSVAHSSVGVPSVVSRIGDLADLFLLQPDTLKFVLGLQEEYDIDAIAPAFVLVNCNNINMREAA